MTHVLSHHNSRFLRFSSVSQDCSGRINFNLSSAKDDESSTDADDELNSRTIGD